MEVGPGTSPCSMAAHRSCAPEPSRSRPHLGPPLFPCAEPSGAPEPLLVVPPLFAKSDTPMDYAFKQFRAPVAKGKYESLLAAIRSDGLLLTSPLLCPSLASSLPHSPHALFRFPHMPSSISRCRQHSGTRRGLLLCLCAPVTAPRGGGGEGGGGGDGSNCRRCHSQIWSGSGSGVNVRSFEPGCPAVEPADRLPPAFVGAAGAARCGGPGSPGGSSGGDFSCCEGGGCGEGASPCGLCHCLSSAAEPGAPHVSVQVR